MSGHLLEPERRAGRHGSQAKGAGRRGAIATWHAEGGGERARGRRRRPEQRATHVFGAA